ncbi:MAG: PilW family protein [Methyloversatilis sp.]|nr:PilW family protein [Methyloversatilis sp.]
MNIFHSSQRGTSLVEVLVTLVLGLVVSAGAIAMVISNREAYRSTEALSRIQESTRTAFELMSRDLRAVGINACNGGRNRVLNLLNNPAANWWSNWSDATRGLRGFDNTEVSGTEVFGTSAGQRITGTDRVEIMHGGTNALTVAVHNASGGDATIGSVSLPKYALYTQQTSNFDPGDLAIVCDFESTAIFQVSGVELGKRSIQHEAILSASPGNCSSGLAFRTPLVCDPVGTSKVFPPGSQIMRFETAAWFIGNNGRTAATGSPRSLYRATALTPTPEEVVEGVRDMQITYMVDDAYRTATEVNALSGGWARVTGVQIVLTIEAPESGTSTASLGARLTRTVSHVVNLRNRVS